MEKKANLKEKVLFVWANRSYFGVKPIQISLLSAIAKKNRFETELYDTSEIQFSFNDGLSLRTSIKIFKPVDLEKYGIIKKQIDLEQSFLKTFESFSPNYLAFSVLNDERLIAKKIALIAKRINPNVIIIWGGKYPTICPEKVLREYPVDFICVGEGLEAFPELLLKLKNNEDPSSIPNIGGITNKKIFINRVRPLKKTLDDLPFLDWDIFDERHFFRAFNGEVKRSGDYMINWGCPYHCSYCINDFNHKLYQNKYFMRRFSNDRVIEELLYLKKRYNINFIKFQDEDFLLRDNKGFQDLSNLYKKYINIPFTIETNPKSITRDNVKSLKNMNCSSVSVAIESGDLTYRKDMLKRVDNKDDIIRAFRLLHEQEIRTSSFNLIGLPFETRDTYETTIKINREAGVQFPNISFFFPYEGTVLREMAIKGKVYIPPVNEEDDLYKHDKPTIISKGMSESQLIGMRNTFVLRIKLPLIFEKYIIRAENDDLIGKRLMTQLGIIYDETIFKEDGWFVEDKKLKEYLMKLDMICHPNQ